MPDLEFKRSAISRRLYLLWFFFSLGSQNIVEICAKRRLCHTWNWIRQSSDANYRLCLSSMLAHAWSEFSMFTFVCFTLLWPLGCSAHVREWCSWCYSFELLNHGWNVSQTLSSCVRWPDECLYPFSKLSEMCQKSIGNLAGYFAGFRIDAHSWPSPPSSPCFYHFNMVWIELMWAQEATEPCVFSACPFIFPLLPIERNVRNFRASCVLCVCVCV